MSDRLMARIEEKENINRGLVIDQITASGSVYDAIRELREQGFVKMTPGLQAVWETDVYRLRRGLCLPCATATAVNLVLNQRIFGDGGIELKIGDLFSLLLPHHGRYKSEDFPRGWLVVTESGDMYHHAIAAVVRGLGLSAQSVQNFEKITDFEELIEQGVKVVISLNNRFVLEQTLENDSNYVQRSGDGKPMIRVITPNGSEFRRFEEGRHAVTLFGFKEQGPTKVALLTDSFNLPQRKEGGLVLEVPVGLVDKYLCYHDKAPTRAIVIGRTNLTLNGFQENNLTVPNEVQRDIVYRLSERQDRVRGLLGVGEGANLPHLVVYP